MAVLLSVINQSTRACEMEDSWRVQYRQSERTALSKTIIWCIIHTVSVVSLLLPPSLSRSLRLCLSPSLWTHPVSCGGYDEAQLSPSHAAPQLLGDYTFQWCIHTRCHSNGLLCGASPATAADTLARKKKQKKNRNWFLLIINTNTPAENVVLVLTYFVKLSRDATTPRPFSCTGLD